MVQSREYGLQDARVTLLHRIILAFKAFRQLGPRSLALYAWYQVGLHTGILRWRSVVSSQQSAIRGVLELPCRESLEALLGEAGRRALIAEADEIIAGQVRLFGSDPVPLELIPPGPVQHWTAYETFNPSARSGQAFQPSDIKLIWEPARFGWAFTLGRAYHLSGDERYAAAFWRYAETFWDANPVNRGPNWISAQEVALRLMAFVFAGQVFAPSGSTTPERLARLAGTIAEHAARIPPTLSYARSQNNNHLLSEAAGLITAGLALPDHPAASRWLALGRKWFDWGLQHQIAADGAYCQHSVNYHRLMLQLALWVSAVDGQRRDAPAGRLYRSRLASAMRWLLDLLDPETGRVPNLGPNDGAYILPLTVLPFSDYRPVLQAASLAFLGEPAFEAGAWDEMALWLKVESSKLKVSSQPSTLRQAQGRLFNLQPTPPSTLHASPSWAYLRAEKFTSRPGHADQLHLDLWWRGLNVAQDAGTYLYNAPPPWDNALTRTAVHNTVTVNGRDQMTHAGRFLWLDWAQGGIIAHEQDPGGEWERLVAKHNGYRRFGVIHQRAVTAFRDGRWLIEDQLLKVEGGRLKGMNLQPATLRQAFTTQNAAQGRLYNLNWLLPDWPYELDVEALSLRILSPFGWITLKTGIQPNFQPSPSNLPPATFNIRLSRAGERLYGLGAASPVEGWTSPTYGTKIPALSLTVEATGDLPLCLTSEWLFPE